MKKLALCIVFLVLGALVLGCTQMNARNIAKMAEEKYKTVKDMKGTMVVTTNFLGKKKVGVIKFAMKKPDKYWSDSENNTIVSNGTVMWIYDKKKNEVTKIKLPHIKRPKFDYGKLIEEMLKGNDVKLLGSEKVGGRDCYVIEVIPKNRTFYSKTLHITSKLWIDKEYWYPLKIELNYGKFSITIEYRNVKFNTGIPDSFFEFKPPEGAKVVERKISMPKKLTLQEAQKQVNFTIITPEYTAGYKFDYAYVSKFGKVETVSLHYTKDGNMLIITESVGFSRTFLPNSTKINVNGTTLEVAQIFGSTLLRIRKGNFEVDISAKLPKDEVIKIGKSIVESKAWAIEVPQT